MAKKEAPYRKSVTIKIPSQNVKPDPRGIGSYRARNSPLPTGDKVIVKGTKTRKKQTATRY